MYIIYNRVCLLLMCALKLYSKIGLSEVWGYGGGGGRSPMKLVYILNES